MELKRNWGKGVNPDHGFIYDSASFHLEHVERLQPFHRASGNRTSGFQERYDAI